VADQGNDTEDRVIYLPNQEKASSKATKAIVVLLLLVSVALTALITFGGWSNLQGAKVIAIFFILVFLVMAYFVNKWNRGVLPLAAGLSVILGVFAAIAAFGAGSWFDRDKTGFNQDGLPPGILGLLCVIMIPVLLLLIAFSMRAFAQKWNVEIEMSREEYERKHRGGGRRGGYSGAQPAEG
jgi:lysylphosphatidylglycerol synthetase-like protein (DUF2156 family)